MEFSAVLTSLLRQNCVQVALKLFEFLIVYMGNSIILNQCVVGTVMHASVYMRGHLVMFDMNNFLNISNAEPLEADNATSDTCKQVLQDRSVNKGAIPNRPQWSNLPRPQRGFVRRVWIA
jgi:hypothetical protein